MSWASDKARDLIAESRVELGPRGKALVERAILDVIEACAFAAAHEHLEDPAIGDLCDAAYDRAVSDCVAAIRKLGEP
jgi:hypothetical protein